MTTPLKRAADRLPAGYRLAVGAVGAVILFLLAVQLLGTATEATAPALRGPLLLVVGGDPSALGAGWLGAYLLGNGSVVAALAVSLFAADLLSGGQLFFMVVGSRLGAAGIVVFIGAVDYFQRRLSLAESVSMGLLTFLLTLSVYLPVAALGYLGLPLVTSAGARIGLPAGWWPFDLVEPVTSLVLSLLGPGASFLLAVAMLFGNPKLFDEVLTRVDTGTLRRRVFDHFQRTWVAFGLGLLVTGMTTSVTFSLGVIVPLYNRGYVKRDELVPYVLGANIGTLLDTLVVAAVLGSPRGITIVLTILGVATAVTTGFLAVSGRYSRAIGLVDDRLLEDRAAFVGFVALLVLIPLGFLVLPMALP